MRSERFIGHNNARANPLTRFSLDLRTSGRNIAPIADDGGNEMFGVEVPLSVVEGCDITPRRARLFGLRFADDVLSLANRRIGARASEHVVATAISETFYFVGLREPFAGIVSCETYGHVADDFAYDLSAARRCDRHVRTRTRTVERMRLQYYVNRV